jgi:hypothetical protein
VVIQEVENLAKGVAVQQIAAKAQPLGYHNRQFTGGCRSGCQGEIVDFVNNRGEPCHKFLCEN